MPTGNYYTELLISYIAPIFFYDEHRTPQVGEPLTTHGTITFFQKDNKVWGITCDHVLYGEHGYFSQEANNPSLTLRIGNFPLNLKERHIYRDKENDLLVISLTPEEHKQIGKRAFKHLTHDIEQLIQQHQKDEDPRTWFIHVAGFPKTYKETQHVFGNEYSEEFGMLWAYMPVTYIAPNPTQKLAGQINLKFIDTRHAIEHGEVDVSVGELSNDNLNFGGMSGGPIYGVVLPNTEDLTLFGIIHQGCGSDRNQEANSLEILYGRPIEALSHVFGRNYL